MKRFWGLYDQRLEGRWAARVSKHHRNSLSNLGSERLLLAASRSNSGQPAALDLTHISKAERDRRLPPGARASQRISCKCGCSPSSGSTKRTRCPCTSSFSVAQCPPVQMKGRTRWSLELTSYDSGSQHLWNTEVLSIPLLPAISLRLTSQSWQYCRIHRLWRYMGHSLDKRKCLHCFPYGFA